MNQHIRISVVAVLGVLLMSGCLTYRAGAPEGAVDVIAHRGASAYAPENTLAAFALAKEMKADWFELDCMLTKDGEVIVIHDGDIERTTDSDEEIKVADLTLAELRRLDAGSWMHAKWAGERLPTLDEALRLGKKKRIGVYVEIKNSDNDNALIDQITELIQDKDKLTPEMHREIMDLIESSGSRNVELTRKCIALIRERRMKRQAVIQSFSPIVCAVAQHDALEIRTEFLASKDEDHPERWPLLLKWQQMFRFAGLNTSKDSLDQELLADCHNQGATVAIYTVDDRNDMRRLARWGVDAIITNRPDVCLKVLAEEGKR